MAELIPMEYRVRAARAARIQRWAFVVTLTAIFCGGGLAYVFGMKQKRVAEYERLAAEYRAKSVIMVRATEANNRRRDLADRMLAMQGLLQDQVLLTLLKNVSAGFSANDCLEYVSVDAHGRGATHPAGPAKAGVAEEEYKYSVRLSGYTKNETTHADLITRLSEIGAKSDPPITITPDTLKRDAMLDGQVMRFQIVCQKPEAKGS